MKLFLVSWLALFCVCLSPAQNLPLPSDGLFASFQTTRGTFLVRLDFQKAPMTVSNFVGLAEGTLNKKNPGQPFYDGLTFHRVEPGLVIQGGDPNGNGSGGPGYSFPDEPSGLKHDVGGVLSMANVGPDTNGSQFFFTLTPLPALDGRYPAFGALVSGMDVLSRIEKGDQILSVRILRQGKAAQDFHVSAESFIAMVKAALQKRQDVLDEASQGTIKTASGLKYLILKEGTGRRPVKGQLISAHYEGRLLNNTIFDSSYARGQPIQFAVGMGQVIPGWDEALLDMKVGEQRKLIIPPELGYGAKGAGNGVIPPNAWLIFTVELIAIQE